jgi:NodT family efflux transporter outer membrane factor (OMF) lipoprotein
MIRNASILVLALLASACSTATMRKPELRTPQAFEGPAGAVDSALTAASLDKWWTLFDDPELTSLVENALTAAPDTKTALARLNEVRANYNEAIFSTLPTGALTGNASRQKTKQLSGQVLFAPVGNVDNLQAAFNVSWEVDLFGRSRAGIRAARADLNGARFAYEAARMSLAAQTAQSLFQARLTAIQLREAKETERISRDLFRVGDIRVQRGLGPSSDAARFEADLATASSEVARLEANLRTSKRTLLVLVGRGADPLDSLTIADEAKAAPGVPATTPGALLARRPDVREAEQKVAGEIGRLQYAKLALFPSFTLKPGLSLSQTSGAYDSTTSAWSLGLGLSIPVLDRPKLMAEAKAESYRGEQAVIAYEKAVQTAYAEAENALAVVDANKTRVERLTLAESRARFAFDAADKGYRAGLTDLTTLLDAERSWRSARNQADAIRSQALVDSVAAFKALGGGWTPPETRVAANGR